ncbi:molecular chaperone HtpG, partial [Leptospira interrogans serovar Pomona]|nr:molecular chaperone HtpG [Leptospira interrogans serovar Pomona]
LKAEGVPAVVLLPEHLRRLSEMGMTGSQNPLDLLKNHTLVINTRSVLVKNILGMSSTKAGKLARTVYDMALLSSKIFGEAEFSEYLKRTTETLEELSAP